MALLVRAPLLLARNRREFFCILDPLFKPLGHGAATPYLDCSPYQVPWHDGLNLLVWMKRCGLARAYHQPASTQRQVLKPEKVRSKKLAGAFLFLRMRPGPLVTAGAAAWFRECKL